nr:ribonuclease H-like domain-containing protein [Tanacetum cinerariifolium]
MNLETAQTTTTVKLPILKHGEYDMWRLRIEQYFQVQYYALWDVIENGNSFKPAAQTTTNVDEVKGTASSSSQNMVFVSSPNSTNKVNTAYGVSTANTQISTANTQVSTANSSDSIVYAFLSSQPNGNRNQDSSRRTVNVKETSSKAMVAIDEAGFDWSYMADDEVLTNMALMAFSDSEEFQQPEFEGYGPKTSNSVSEDISNEVKESPDAPLVKELVSDDKPKTVNTARLNSTVVTAVRANQVNDVKALACHTSKETRSNKDYILMPLWKDGLLFDSSSKNANNNEPQPYSDAGKKDDRGGPVVQGKGLTHPVESHHTPTSAPSTSQPPVSPTSRRITRQEFVVPQPRSPTQSLVAYEVAFTGVDVKYKGATTTVTGLEVGRGSGNIDKTPTMPYDSPLPRVNILKSDEGSMTQQELMVFCTTLSKKVESLEKYLKQTKQIYDDLKDPSKQGRKITEIDQDPGISLTKTKLQQEQERLGFETTVRLQAELDEEERLGIARVHESASSFNVEEWEDIQAIVKADEELVQRLQAKERETYTKAEQARMLEEFINQRQKYFAAQRDEEGGTSHPQRLNRGTICLIISRT